MESPKKTPQDYLKQLTSGWEKIINNIQKWLQTVLSGDYNNLEDLFTNVCKEIMESSITKVILEDQEFGWLRNGLKFFLENNDLIWVFIISNRIKTNKVKASKMGEEIFEVIKDYISKIYCTLFCFIERILITEFKSIFAVDPQKLKNWKLFEVLRNSTIRQYLYNECILVDKNDADFLNSFFENHETSSYEDFLIFAHTLIQKTRSSQDFMKRIILGSILVLAEKLDMAL